MISTLKNIKDTCNYKEINFFIRPPKKNVFGITLEKASKKKGLKLNADQTQPIIKQLS